MTRSILEHGTERQSTFRKGENRLAIATDLFFRLTFFSRDSDQQNIQLSNDEEIYRVSTKSLYNFQNLLRRQMKRQIGGNYFKMRCIYLSFLFVLMRVCYSEHGKKSSPVLM